MEERVEDERIEERVEDENGGEQKKMKAKAVAFGQSPDALATGLWRRQTAWIILFNPSEYFSEYFSYFSYSSEYSRGSQASKRCQSDFSDGVPRLNSINEVGRNVAILARVPYHELRKDIPMVPPKFGLRTAKMATILLAKIEWPIGFEDWHPVRPSAELAIKRVFIEDGDQWVLIKRAMERLLDGLPRIDCYRAMVVLAVLVIPVVSIVSQWSPYVSVVSQWSPYVSHFSLQSWSSASVAETRTPEVQGTCEFNYDDFFISIVFLCKWLRIA